MKVKFWGVRGSLPRPLPPWEYRDKLHEILKLANGVDVSTKRKREKFLKSLPDTIGKFFGGNTPCVEAIVNGERIIFDLGSGARELGKEILDAHTKGEPEAIRIFLSHTHWDHIMGFPFFLPAFSSDFTLHFYSPHGSVKERLEYQQEKRFFPVSLDAMKAKKKFPAVKPGGRVNLGEVTVANKELHHPGKSFAYRVFHKGKSFIYASDAEYNKLNYQQIEEYVTFFQDADLLIFDAMYSFHQELVKVDWGHSSAPVGIDIAVKAQVKKLALFHHDPDNTDKEICELLDIAMRYKNETYPDSPLEIFLAVEGAEVKL